WRPRVRANAGAPKHRRAGGRTGHRREFGGLRRGDEGVRGLAGGGPQVCGAGGGVFPEGTRFLGVPRGDRRGDWRTLRSAARLPGRLSPRPRTTYPRTAPRALAGHRRVRIGRNGGCRPLLRGRGNLLAGGATDVRRTARTKGRAVCETPPGRGRRSEPRLPDAVRGCGAESGNPSARDAHR